MGQRGKGGWRRDDLGELIQDIIVDAYDDNEQLCAFRQVFEDNVSLPASAFVIGEPVSIIGIDYEGSELRGLTAKLRRDDGSEYVVAVCDVVFPEKSAGARYVAAYRKWLGLDPYPAAAPPPSTGKRKGKADDNIPFGEHMDLVVLSVKERAARCRILGKDQVITFRASDIWNLVPGEIVTVKPRKTWRYGGHPYLSGAIERARLDVKALGLVPLRLESMGEWDPEDEYWCEEGEPIEDWAKPIIARGPRPAFEMEQSLPGADFDDPFSDPITISNDLKEAGDYAGASRVLMDLCQSDLRCLDAHAHLGNMIFDHRPGEAIRHYETGFRIGELLLGKNFDGVLPWGFIDNRPFLRCMHGYGLCLWRLNRFDEAATVLDRMLWLNPADNQGVRFLINDVKTGKEWEEEMKE